jgi:hypothetical protein
MIAFSNIKYDIDSNIIGNITMHMALKPVEAPYSDFIAFLVIGCPNLYLSAPRCL